MSTRPYTPAHHFSLHDALPISCSITLCVSETVRLTRVPGFSSWNSQRSCGSTIAAGPVEAPRTSWPSRARSEEHTSELQSRRELVCRLLLEKKKQTNEAVAA